MSYRDQCVSRAAQMPVYDAAYFLWSEKARIDFEETGPRKPKEPADLRDQKVFQRVVREAIGQVLHDRANAPEGPIFAWLRQAHPACSDDELRKAIRMAVKLDTDCSAFFDDDDGSDKAVELARKENPGFQEYTYDRASFRLKTAMR